MRRHHCAVQRWTAPRSPRGVSRTGSNDEIADGIAPSFDEATARRSKVGVNGDFGAVDAAIPDRQQSVHSFGRHTFSCSGKLAVGVAAEPFIEGGHRCVPGGGACEDAAAGHLAAGVDT